MAASLTLLVLKKMWWLVFLFVSLVDAASLSLKTKHHGMQTTGFSSSQKNLSSEYDKVTMDLLQSFTAAHTLNHHRQKREISDIKTSLLIDERGVFRLQALKPKLKLCNAPLEIKFIDINNYTFAICISAPSSSLKSIHLGYVSLSSWTPLVDWHVIDPEHIAAFYENGLLYILIADRGREDGTDIMKYDVTTGQLIVDHTVHSRYPTAIAIWKMKVNGKYQMAIANSAGSKEASDLNCEIYIYNWMGTYFDIYTSVQAYDVKDIEPFHIHGAAYFAVANYRKGYDDYFVDSEVFKYNLDKGVWLSHQRIKTYGAMDWQFFSMGESTGEEFFLVVANHVEYGKTDHDTEANSMIYKYVKDKFVPFQCLKTYGATSIAVMTDDLRFLLAIANEYEGVSLYQYDGWRFVPASVQYTQSTMSSGVNSVSFHYIKMPNTETLVLAAANPINFLMDPSLHEIIFVHENLMKEWHDKSIDWCMNSLNSFEQPATSNIFNQMKNLFFVDQKKPIVINGKLSFTSNLEVAKLKTPKLHDLASNTVYDDSVLLSLKHLDSRLQSIQRRLEIIQDTLASALKLDGNQNMTASYDFEDVQFECKNDCEFHDITTIMLNGENVTNLSKNVLFLNEPHSITSPIFAEKIAAESITVAGLINGLDTKQLVTKSGKHLITGTKVFTKDIHTNDVEVGGLFDGIPISREFVLLTTGHQEVTGNLTFSQIGSAWLEVSGLVNGIDFTKFYQDLVFHGGSSVITGTKTFSSVMINNLELKPGSTVNGVDLNDLWNHALWLEGDQVIQAPMTFSSATLMKNLNVSESVNGIKIPEEVLLLNQNAVITVPQTFNATIFISDLKIRNSINGVGMTNKEKGELDILLKTGQQALTGEKKFRSIFLGGNSFVDGKVDGVDLSEFFAMALHRDAPVISNSTWVFNNLIVKGPLHLSGTLSGIDIKSIYDKALKLNESSVPAFNDFVFKSVVHIQNLETDNINGINASSDLVLKNKPQTITGVKTFTNIVLKENIDVIGLVNKINMSFLNDILLRFGNQVITSDKIFGGNLKTNNLVVNGFINGVPFDDIVTIDGDDYITATQIFESLTVDNLVVNEMKVTGLVNGVNVDVMIDNAMTYEGLQTVSGTKTVQGSIVIMEGANLNTNSLNGIDISELFGDAVLVDVPQDITSKKTFAGPVAFDDIWVKDSIDGVTEWDMKHNWLLRGQDQIIEGNIRFTENVAFQSLFVQGLVNGVNISELNATLVKTNVPSVIKGPIMFENVISEGDVTLSKNIQGIDFSNEAALKSKDNIITGVKTFTSDVAVQGSFTVDGLIDGVSVDEICKNAIFLNRKENITHLIIQGDVTLESALVNGKLAGVDIMGLYQVAVNAADNSVTLSGLKTFDSLTVEGDIIIDGFFGGTNIKDLSEKYMSISRDQEITGTLHFEELEIKETLIADSLLVTGGKINDIDVRMLNESVLKTTGHQTVNAAYHFSDVIFQDDVIVVGKVNGIEIPKGLMKKNKTNYIFSPKIFQKDVYVLGDIDMGPGMKIQDIDMSSWEQRAVKKNYGNFSITGTKAFTDVTANDVRVEGLIDGLELSENTLLLTYGGQTITGAKVITDTVVVEGSFNVNGLVNGTNLTDLAERAVRHDRKAIITGVKTFIQPLKIRALKVGLVDGIDVHELQSRVYQDIDFSFLEKRMEEIDDAVAHMHVAFDNQAVLLQYYEFLNGFDVPGAYCWVYASNSETELLMLSDLTMKNSCSSIIVYRHNQLEGFKFEQVLKASSAVVLRSLVIWDDILLVVGNRQSNPQCLEESPFTMTDFEDTATIIYSWDPEGDAFHLYQTLPTTSPVFDIATFTDGDEACLVNLGLHGTEVFCAADKFQDFLFRERIRSEGGRKAALIRSEEKLMLAISTFDILQPSLQKSVDIYFWNKGNSSFGHPAQIIRSTYPQSVILMNHTDRYETKTFLVISEGIIPGVNNEPRLFLYKYNKKGIPFTKYQEIKDYGELDWITLPSGDLLFFALDTRVGQIKVYQYKGASGFIKKDTVSAAGAKSIHVFTRNFAADIDHYLALSGPKNLMSLSWEDKPNAMILKSKIKGGRLPHEN